MHMCVRHFLYRYSYFYSSHLPHLELLQMDRTIHPAWRWVSTWTGTVTMGKEAAMTIACTRP